MKKSVHNYPWKLFPVLVLMLFLYLPFGYSQTAWDGSTDTDWYTSDPTATSYDIYTAEELAGLAELVNGGNKFVGKTVNLMSDVWLNADGSTTNSWPAIGGLGATGETTTTIVFSGKFDGHHNVIYNLYCDKGEVNGGSYNAGLFGAVQGNSATDTAVVQNVIVKGAYVRAYSVQAVIVALAKGSNPILVKNCMAINVEVVGRNAAGIVSSAYNQSPKLIIENCAVTHGNIWGASASDNGGVGGNMGSTNTQVRNCYFQGTVNNGAASGGKIVGNYGTMTNCYAASNGGGNGGYHTSTLTSLDSADMLSDNFWQNQLTAGTFKADCRALNNGYPILEGFRCGVPVTGVTDICSGQSTTLTATGWDSYVWNTSATTASITVSPTTTTSYYVTGTTGDNSMVDTVTVYVSQNIQVAATIALSPDGDAHGTITASAYSQSCASSSPITISITAETGYYIAKIVVNGVVAETFDVNEALTYSYVISSPQSTSSWDVVAHLDNKFTVTTTKVLNDEDETVITASGLVSPNNGNFIIRGLGDTTVYFHETARYHIEDVIVDGTPYGAVDSVELTDVLDNVEIKVVYSDDCGFTSLPYTDDFESYGTGSANFPECHEKLTTYSTYPYVNSNATYASSGSKYVYFYGAAATDYNIFVLPMMKVEDVEITDLRVKFSARASSTASTMEVGVMSNALDASSFVSCGKAAFTTANVHNLYKIYLDEYTGNGKFIAFKFTAGTAYAYAYLDDIAIELIPACIEVENLSADYIAGNSALVSWDASISEPGGYNLEWREAGGDWTEEYVEENYFPLQDLTATTKYEVRVNADCGDETSVWDTITFHTLCDQSDDLQVGTGTSTSYSYYFPVAYYNAYSQQLFEASELGNAAKEIKTIQLQYYNATPITRNIDIYLGHTTRSSFSAAADFIPLSSMSKVFSGKVTFNNKGEDYWMTIVLDSAFEYNGTGNLVFAFDDNGGAGSSLTGGGYSRFYNHSASGKTVAFYQSSATGANIDPAATTPGGTSYLPAYRNNIRFGTCEEAVCIQPNAFRATGNDVNAIDLAWIENTTADGYELEYKRNSVTTWTPEDFVQGNTYQLGGLSSNTLYDIRLRSNCSDDPDTSAWVVISARTACDLVVESDLPFTENFDSYQANEYPFCWSRMTTGANLPYVHRTASDVHSSPSAMDFHYSPGCANVAVLPEFDMDIAELQMDFWVKSRTDVGRLLVGVMDAPGDYSSFVCVDTVKTQAHQTFQEYSVKFDTYEGDGKFIAFSWTDGTSTTYLVDDIYVDKIPTCSRPEAMSVDSVKSTSAYISWTELGTPSQYLVEVGPSGFAYGEGEAEQEFTTNDNPLEITGLSANTKYDVYVQADCGSTGLSFSVFRTFTTACADGIALGDLPYTESFDNYGTGNTSTSFPTCWKRRSTYVTNYPYISATNASAPGSMYFYASATTHTTAISEKFDFPVDALQVKFKFRTNSTSAGMTVGVMSDPTNDTTFTPIQTVLNSVVNEWQSHTVYLNDYTGTGRYIAFRLSSAAGIYLDDVEIDLSPACIPAQNITVSNQTTTSADFTWTGPENAGSYEIEVGLPGFVPGDNSAVVSTTTSDEFYYIPLNTLTDATAYVFAVRSVCDDDGESEWSFLNFGTVAEETYGDGVWNGYVYDMATPYTFGNYLGMVTENEIFNRTAATNVVWSGATSLWAGTAPHDNFGVRYKMAKTFPCGYYTFTVGNDDHVRLSIDGGESWLILGSWSGGGGCCTNYSNDTAVYFSGDEPTELVMEFYEVGGAATANFSYAAETVAVTISNLTPWSVDLTFGGDDAVNLVVSTTVETDPSDPENAVEETPSLTDNPYTVSNLSSDSTYHIYVQTDCGGPWNHIVVTIPSSCPAPTGLSATDIEAFTATLTWDALGMTGWNLKVSTTPLTGLDTATGDFFDGPVSANNYPLTGLTASTTYYWYVRSDCGAGVFSAPGSASFRTECDLLALPYTESFESYTGTSYSVAGVVPDCWNSLYTDASNPQYAPHVTNQGTASYPKTGTKALSLYAGSGNTAYAVLPKFATPVEDCILSFWYRFENASSGTMTLGFIKGDQDDMSTFTALATIAGTTTVTEYVYDFSAATTDLSDATRIVVRWYKESTWYTASIDDISVYANTCPSPTSLTASNITAQSADISWTAGGSETEWTLKHGPAGFNVNTGGTTVGNITTPSYTINTGLSPGTHHDVYVQANCSGDDNSMWSKTSFQVPCGVGNIASMGYSEGAGSIPWVENFNTYTDAYKLAQDWAGKGQSLPDCWTNVTSVGAGSGIPIYVHGSNLRLDFGGVITSGFRAAVMPELPAEVDVTQLKMKFDYARNASGTYVKVCMTDNPSSTDSTDYELVAQTTTTSTSLTSNSISFADFSGSGRYIAFVVEDGGG
ncbi:fibronectin type III domain-containing protein, partial [Bacteroidales bacterium OttesenSCG-928-E04]|nr:fibronectin type III domain-containing protein [Bacteroidales bacterium OttesenSCG-928-E04]